MSLSFEPTFLGSKAPRYRLDMRWRYLPSATSHYIRCVKIDQYFGSVEAQIISFSSPYEFSPVIRHPRKASCRARLGRIIAASTIFASSTTKDAAKHPRHNFAAKLNAVIGHNAATNPRRSRSRVKGWAFRDSPSLHRRTQSKPTFATRRNCGEELRGHFRGFAAKRRMFCRFRRHSFVTGEVSRRSRESGCISNGYPSDQLRGSLRSYR